VVSQRPWLSVNNDDRYWGCEIDLPATLDEEMSITTSKQRVILSERIWNLLKEKGVLANIAALRRRYDDEKAKAKAKREKRASAQTAAQAMAAAEKFRTDKAPETPERRKKSEQAVEREVDKRAEDSGVDRETVKVQLEEEVRETPYKIAEESLKGAPFFRVEQIGPQKVLYLNTAHRFYRDVYAGQESTPRLRAAIQIVLFTFGVGEVDAEGDRLLFLQTERGAWSTRLENALAQFEKLDAADEVRETDEDQATPD
jgi:RNA-binding protein YhbY